MVAAMIAKAFFDIVRDKLFEGVLDQSRVDGLNALVTAWQKATADHRWQAYGLATAYHETDRTMRPIEEYGHGVGKTYGSPDIITKLRYYGRGYVQLTWAHNYQKMSDLLGVDIYHAPERALEPDIAARVMTEGMMKGTFTGKKLSDYFNDESTDWYDARRIINGLDRAHIIAGYAQTFARALEAAHD